MIFILILALSSKLVNNIPILSVEIYFALTQGNFNRFSYHTLHT
ncbi:hypothetical protein yrohd0001_22990 [Yersinia rohdei ATCC 43380]|nr:hypothetical protein yrohd0001_22990 [Yersinia rohdei ATCC 43380]